MTPNEAILQAFETTLSTAKVPSEILSEAVSLIMKSSPGSSKFAVQESLFETLHELLRTGVLSWGSTFENPDPPRLHITRFGRTALQNFTKDPYNPVGYKQALAPLVSEQSIAWAYIEESLRALNSNCFRASAVLIGAASEDLAFVLRDRILKCESDNANLSKSLRGTKISDVLNGLSNYFHSHKNSMDRSLRERFESFWDSFSHQIRISRNEAGHPTSIEAITQELAHANLLQFHSLAEMYSQLHAWIDNRS